MKRTNLVLPEDLVDEAMRLSGALEKALAEPSIVARFADLGTVLFPAGRRGPDAARDPDLPFA